MKIADEFQALVDCLEIFPSKVKAHIESMRSSFWMSLWGFIKRVTTFILDVRVQCHFRVHVLNGTSQHKALILSFGAELLTFFGSNTAHLGSFSFILIFSTTHLGNL